MKKILVTIAGAGLAAATLLLSACGTLTVSQADVENQISTQLQKQVGQKPDDVTCPGDLQGKVGTTMRCTLTAGDSKYGVNVKVTSVEGNKVLFNIKVDDQAS
ncbi:DUF4333 domain-containing protein [Microlunatus elymi]|uniref:DUF4333 domain-containing protein n=1 Tax=Microlunatus elymi TaxID=2596828 RepID=A0A516Q180_9ACTN|nr:DUF4333 domain-containing protein [Microlunatus elymi]QDP97158.1 DUF4333 domain-containing protein [Microlunatus elymi]